MCFSVFILKTFVFRSRMCTKELQNLITIFDEFNICVWVLCGL